MVLELIGMFILFTTMISVIVVSWQKQKEKQHRRHIQWMKQQLNNGGNNDNSRNYE